MRRPWARAGDEVASAALYRVHAPRIARYCRAHTASPEDAEDATQTTFCNAWAAIGRYQDRGAALNHWLLTIAHNVVTDLRRKQRALVRPFSDGLADHLPDDAPPPDEIAVRRLDHAQLAATLIAAIATLPLTRRETILARYGAGATHTQLASAMHISSNHVRVIQHRALRQLRKALTS